MALEMGAPALLFRTALGALIIYWKIRNKW